MFSYQRYDVEVVRNLVIEWLRWPAPREAADETGLGLNCAYMDLRWASWSAARAAFAREDALIARIEYIPSENESIMILRKSPMKTKIFFLDLGMHFQLLLYRLPDAFRFPVATPAPSAGTMRNASRSLHFTRGRRPPKQSCLARSKHKLASTRAKTEVISLSMPTTSALCVALPPR